MTLRHLLIFITAAAQICTRAQSALPAGPGFTPTGPSMITGQVISSTGAPVPNVLVSVMDANHLTYNNGTPTTNPNGAFAITNLSPTSAYTVTPSRPGASFNPPSITLNSLPPGSGYSITFTIVSCATVTAISPITPASSGTAIIGADGTIGFMLSVTAPSPACSWQVSLPDKWITPHGTLGGAGSGTFYVDIASNATGAQRNSIIQVSGAAFTISQQPYIQVFGTGIVTTKPNLSFLQDGLLDPHYTITSEPAGISKPSATNSYVVNSSYYPSTAWFPNNQAKWITPELPVANTGLQGVPPGTYTYQTTFDLTGFILSTVTITGRWGADDTGTMSVNGLVNTASPAGGTGAPCSYGFQCANPFTLTQANGLVAGLNTLTFVVTNLLTFNNASGLYVEISGSGTQGPDFSVSANPPTKTAPAGTQVQYPISITNLNGYTGAPLITVAAPANVTASFSNNTVFASSSIPGTYTIPVTATDSAAGLNHIFNLTYTANSIGLAPFTIFSTGLSDPDPNYWIAQSPDWRFAVQPRQVLASNPVNTPLFTTWRANTASSDWIAPRPDEGLGNNGSSSTANYRYRTKFYLFQQDPTHSTISGNFVADASAKIWLNGYQQGPIAASPANATNFNLTNNLTWGENTLDFEVVNTNTGPDRPTGVNAVLSGQGNSVATPGFQVIPSPIIQSVTAGSTATYGLQATEFNGLNKTINFTAAAPASSTGITVTPSTGTLGAQLTLSAATTYLTVPGAYEIPFNATLSDNSASYNIKPVLLVQPQPPTIGPISISGATSSGTLTFVMTPGTAYASYTQFLINTTISGTNDCQVLHENDGVGGHFLFLSPPDWATSGWQGPLRPGQAGTLNNGRCALDVGASSVSINTSAANQTTYNLKFSFAASWAGAKNVYFNPSNSYFQAIPWTLVGTWTVPGTTGSPAFSISATAPIPTSIVAGGGVTAQSTVTISPANGFNLTSGVTLSASATNGITGSFGTLNTTTGTSTLTITVPANVPANTYPVTISGVSNGGSQSSPNPVVNVIVTAPTSGGDYTLTTIRGYDSVGIPATGNAVYTFVVRVQSLSGYHGTVTLTPTVDPAISPPIITCSSASITVASNQSADATIFCLAPSTLVPQRSYINNVYTYPSYNVTAINATDGSISHALTGAANIPLVLTPLPWLLPTVPTVQLPSSVTAGTAQPFTMSASWKPTGVDSLGYPTVGGEVWLRLQDQALGPDVASGSCTIMSASSGAVWLNDDSGVFQGQAYANGSGPSETNSQCTADFKNGTAIFTVANQTWSSMTPITFKPAWKGKTVHVYVHSRNDGYSFSGWRDWGPLVIQ